MDIALKLKPQGLSSILEERKEGKRERGSCLVRRRLSEGQREA